MAESATEKKPKTTPMRWLKLGEAKDPEFNQMVFLYDSKINSPNDAANIGWLKGIESASEGKNYKFCTGDDGEKEIIESRFTHYCIIKSPTE